jgi:hypothetical protein
VLNEIVVGRINHSGTQFRARRADQLARQRGQEQEALADMARDHASAKSVEAGRLMEKIRRGFDVIAFARRTDHRDNESDKGFRISSLRLMAAEREAADA